MKKRHYSIPIFVPELACPHQCIYCNQHLISGINKIPNSSDVISTIESYLSTINYAENEVEVGFFGGSFTGISIEEQINYLQLVQPYINRGIVKSIRISTRPDYITEENLLILKKYNVKTIELGAQSLDNEVLAKSERGHFVADVEKASVLIKSYEFDLGLQMMIGLPGDNLEKSIATANKIIELKADNTRIYPCVIIKNTKLEQLYLNDEYLPLSLSESIIYLKKLITLFEDHDIKIIRVGLHPSKDLDEGAFIAGPYHPSMRQIAETEIWFDLLKHFEYENDINKHFIVYVSYNQRNNAIGYQAKNKKFLEQFYYKVSFVVDENLINRNYYVDFH
jgi:histone acetyltransferase (RNA polymerase elongator complex component)